jgi:hypothetical protein
MNGRNFLMNFKGKIGKFGFYQNFVIESDTIKNRDRAYTFLAVAVETVRRSAHYALWNDKKRLRGYASEYFRKSTSYVK